MVNLTDKEMVSYTRKLIKYYFPTAKVESRPVDPKLVIFALYLHNESVRASAQIKLLEELWKGTVNPSKIKSLKDLGNLLRGATKEAIKGYLKGDVKIMVKNTITLKFRSIVTMYFNYRMDDHPYNYIRKK